MSSTRNIENEQTCTKSFTKNEDDSAILGVTWNENEDILKVTFPHTSVETTKRGVLKYLASIYDPIGLISPILLMGKILYRDICDNRTAWDQPLKGDLLLRWRK